MFAVGLHDMSYTAHDYHQPNLDTVTTLNVGGIVAFARQDIGMRHTNRTHTAQRVARRDKSDARLPVQMDKELVKMHKKYARKGRILRNLSRLGKDIYS